MEWDGMGTAPPKHHRIPLFYVKFSSFQSIQIIVHLWSLSKAWKWLVIKMLSSIIVAFLGTGAASPLSDHSQKSSSFFWARPSFTIVTLLLLAPLWAPKIEKHFVMSASGLGTPLWLLLSSSCSSDDSAYKGGSGSSCTLWPLIE